MNSLADFSAMLEKQSAKKQVKVDYYITKLKEIESSEIDSSELQDLINRINLLSNPWRINPAITCEDIDKRIEELQILRHKLKIYLDAIKQCDLS